MAKKAEQKDSFVLISQTDDNVTKAIKTDNGILVKSITTTDKGESESMILIENGVLVNHGSDEKPDWKLNR